MQFDGDGIYCYNGPGTLASFRVDQATESVATGGRIARTDISEKILRQPKPRNYLCRFQICTHVKPRNFFGLQKWNLTYSPRYAVMTMTVDSADARFDFLILELPVDLENRNVTVAMKLDSSEIAGIECSAPRWDSNQSDSYFYPLNLSGNIKTLQSFTNIAGDLLL